MNTNVVEPHFSPPPLLTVREVARILRFTEAAIRRMIRAEEMPAIRIGKEYRVPQRVVENMLNPLSEANLGRAGFGMWKGKPEGAKWVSEHRRKDKRSLKELLEDLRKP